MPLAQPAGVSRAALDVAGEQLDAGEQAADAAHVVVAVAADLVADAVEDKGAALNGSSGFRLSLSVKSSPVSSGQKSLGNTPLGLNMMTSRCARGGGLAKPRLGRFRMNGRAAAPRPRSRMNSRRDLNVAIERSHAKALSRKEGRQVSITSG